MVGPVELVDTPADDCAIAIGTKIARLLEARDQSAAWLADRVGVPRSTISRIIRAERNPTADTLREVAIALAMSPEELVAGTRTACPEADPIPAVPREHFDTAMEQLLRLERETMDLRARVREAEEALATERARRVADSTEHAAMAGRVAAAEEKARFHQEEARRYHDALELAVLDVSRLRTEVENLSKATENGSSVSRIAALLAGVAAVASVAAYVTRATDAKASSKAKAAHGNKRGK